MINKIKKAIEKYNLITKGDRIIIAISGGADSVCLLHILNSLKEEYNLELYGAHLNHNFRGMQAQMDVQYVVQLCEKLDILCFVKSLDVPQYAKKYGMSMEEAGRNLRYEFFEEILEKVGASKIAVAHNLNDQAETVLMRLLRGTGIQGLTAIRHKRKNIIRPLLDISRKDIETYCSVHNLSPRIDETNLEPIYHRNKIRLELIPYLEKNYNPNIIESLAKTAEILQKDSEFMDQEAIKAYNNIKISSVDKCLVFSMDGINILHGALKARVFRLATEELVGKREALEYKHIHTIIELSEKGETGKKVQLPMGIIAKTSYEKMILTTEDKEDDVLFDYSVSLEKPIYVSQTDAFFEFKLVDKKDIKEISRDKYIKYFDYDRVKSTLNIRNRREGDRFWPLGLKGSKKLKDFFIDYKIEREKREIIPLLCDGDEIIWVVGYRTSEHYKIVDETKRILIVEYKLKTN